jgi:DNA transformation protein
MNEPEKLINIGPKSSAWLRQIGIRTREQLVASGALGAFIKIKRAGFRPGLNLLYALEGAILQCHWRDLPEGRRGELMLEAEAASVGLPPLRGKAAPPAEPVRMVYSDEDPRMSKEPTYDTHRDEN